MIIAIQCADELGLVASISGVVQKQGLNIISMREHVDTEHQRFFVRLELSETGQADSIQEELLRILPPHAQVLVNPNPLKKIVVLVTKEHHCLGDILIRNHFDTLGAQVQAVIGNHPDLKELCERFQIPFQWVSHEEKSKEIFEEELHQAIAGYEFEYLVLAKFMRILSQNFVSKYPLRMVNIHHSFLPAFAGANPYRQAHERGVKIIGATAHFVTDQLDEGPIIVQQVTPINHSFSAQAMMKSGREIETAVLAKALKLVFEDRVMVYGNKTVVFE